MLIDTGPPIVLIRTDLVTRLGLRVRKLLQPFEFAAHSEQVKVWQTAR